jgi:hypothetical protein
MTKAEVQALIDSKLASGTEILAEEHREVETALLNYLDGVVAAAPLARGTVSVGDIMNPSIIPVTFTQALDTADYIVTGSMVSLGNISNDVSGIWVIRSKTTTGFSLIVGEVNRQVQNLQFDYVVFRK